MENVRVRRAGFAYRLTYDSFLKRYRCLSKQTWPRMNTSSLTLKDNTSLILKELKLDDDVRYGITKVFIRSSQTVFSLENYRTEKIPEIVTFLQKVNF